MPGGAFVRVTRVGGERRVCVQVRGREGEAQVKQRGRRGVRCEV